MERTAAHRDRDVEAARFYGELPDAAAGRRVAVAAEQRRSRLAEAFQVDLVADAVARPGNHDAVPGGHRLQVAVIVGVLVAHLRGIMVDVGNREFGCERFNPHRFELEVRHRARGILRKALVDVDTDFSSRFKRTFAQMSLEYPGNDATLHVNLLSWQTLHERTN